MEPASVSSRLTSLAAGTILDVGPAGAVDVAASAGFRAVGLWFDPTTWTDAVTSDVAARLAATGVTALDLEPIIFGRGDDHGERIIEIAAALGVPNVLVAGGPADRAAATERLAALSDRAASEAPGVRLVFEFLPIFRIGTLAEAASIVAEIGAPNLGVLVDSLHLARSGSSPDDAAAVAHLLPYLQLADAGPVAPVDPAELRDEALNGRLLPGDGVLPLAELLAAVPDVPVSIELRSRALMERHPDPVERARAVLASVSPLGLR